MISDKLGRRNFLKYCTATAIGSGLMINPLSVFSNENEKLKQKKEKFKLSKPRWIIYDNGSYDLISKEIILKNCRPSIDGQSVMPKNVFLGDSPKGKRIVYELPGGFLMLDLKTNKNSISIGTEFSGFSKAPQWFCPISQAKVLGVDHYFKQSYGTDGPSGVYPMFSNEQTTLPTSWSNDSFLTFGLLGKEETIAIGNTNQNDFLQRFSIYNRPHYEESGDKKTNENQVFLESGMLLDEIHIDNEYIKLPELHFYSGNKPLETFQELAWQISKVSNARQGSPTSYHWISPSSSEPANCFKDLKKQIEVAKQNTIPIHTFCIKNYCIEGDWMEPYKEWPGGLDNAARSIYKEGFRAGISLSPFRVSEKSKLFRTHEDWLLNDNHNKKVIVEIINGERFFALDLSHPSVQKHIAKVFRTLRKMGFIFYETQHMNYAFKYTNEVIRKVYGKSSVQIFREICSLIRTEIGPGSLWMASQTPYSPLIGFVDIVKIVNHDEGKWNSEKLDHFIRETWYTHYFNNIFWQNSPGEISLVNENGLSENEKQSIALWSGFLGGAVGTSDSFASFNEEQLKAFRFLEPNKQQQYAYLPFWPDYDRVKVAIRVYKNPSAWGILFFNDKPDPIQQVFDIFDLIEEEETFVYSWDTNKMDYGKLSQISIWLEPHQSKLFYLTEKDEGPNKYLSLGGKIPKEK